MIRILAARCGDGVALGEQISRIVQREQSSTAEVRLLRSGPTDLLRSDGAALKEITSYSPHVLIVSFPDFESSEQLSQTVSAVAEKYRAPQFIIAAPWHSSDEMLQCYGCGASDVWMVPVADCWLGARFNRWIRDLGREAKENLGLLKSELGLDQFVGESPAVMKELRKLKLIGTSDLPVLIRGETGTGKEICARAIHYLSRRRSGPFLAVNCGALPENLVENELFGHEAGAFTGANARSLGLIGQAEGGTLFLDEIDSIPYSAQAKLLRVTQDKTYHPLGGRHEQTADIRIVTATHADLEREISAGRFRQDLFYRLNMMELMLPPLRDRGEDIDLLARHFLNRINRHRVDGPVALAPEALHKLRCYRWPGNVRELENVITRVAAICPRRVIGASDIELSTATLHRAHPGSFKTLKAQAIQEFERSYLEQMLSRHQWNISRAADAAQMDRRAFWELMRKLGLARDNSGLRP